MDLRRQSTSDIPVVLAAVTTLPLPARQAHKRYRKLEMPITDVPGVRAAFRYHREQQVFLTPRQKCPIWRAKESVSTTSTTRRQQATRCRRTNHTTPDEHLCPGTSVSCLASTKSSFAGLGQQSRKSNVLEAARMLRRVRLLMIL
jgi:hypothetical protein